MEDNNLYYIIDDEGTEITHDALRVSDNYTIELIIKNSPQINHRMEDEIRDLLIEFRNHKWEFKGDNELLGYVFNVWDGKHEDIIFTEHILFEDYKI